MRNSKVRQIKPKSLNLFFDKTLGLKGQWTMLYDYSIDIELTLLNKSSPQAMYLIYPAPTNFPKHIKAIRRFQS